MITLFIDTTIFLQCKPLNELNWKNLSEGSVQIYIPIAVQEEIDKNKQNGNSRRSERSRKANKIMRDIIHSPNEILKIGDLAAVSFSPILKIDKNVSNELNWEKPDDNIIGEILTYKKDYPDEDVTLVAHDGGILLKAKRHGISFYEIPDNWFLPPETDSKDNLIAELKKENKALRDNQPVINISFLNDKDILIDNFTTTVNLYEGLDDALLDQTIQSLVHDNPMETEFNNYSNHKSLSIILASRSVEQEARYQGNYLKWENEIKTYLTDLPEILENQSRYFYIYVDIDNPGNSSAEYLLCQIKALDGLIFATKRKYYESIKEPSIPVPPVPPKKQLLNFLNQNKYREAWNIPSINPTPPRRNRYDLYWKTKPDNSTNIIELECEDFRHKMGSHRIEIPIFIPAKEQIITNGVIECLVSANNLQKPINKYLPIAISTKLIKIKSVLDKYIKL